MVAQSDGSEPREVFGGWAVHSAWSPTGDRIAFSDGESLRLLDVATGEVTQLTEEERGTDLRLMGFSPEGDRVLFSTSNRTPCGASAWTAPTPASSSPGHGRASGYRRRRMNRPRRVLGRPRRRRAPSPTCSTATSTWPIRTARTRSGSRTAVPKRTAPALRRVLGGGTDVVAGRAVPRLSLLGLFRPRGRGRDVVISDAEGNVIATFPARWMGHRVVARFHTRRGVGCVARNGRRLRGRRRSSDPAHDAVRMDEQRR